jgi:transcriptional regulator NrdR family protein
MFRGGFADVTRVCCVALVVTAYARFAAVSRGFTDVSRVFRGVHSMRYARFTNISQVFRGQYTL